MCGVQNLATAVVQIGLHRPQGYLALQVMKAVYLFLMLTVNKKPEHVFRSLSSMVIISLTVPTFMG